MIEIVSEDFNIEKIAESGQCFRLNKDNDCWVNICGDKILKIYGNKLDCSRSEYNKLWRAYFDLETDYSAFRGMIPENDVFLSQAADFGKGIRILKQDVWETLITFIISQRKNIPAIKKSVEALCDLFGDAICDKEGRVYHTFPSPEALASADESALKNCSLGYRVPYILDTARSVAEGKIDLASLENLNDDDLLEALMEMHGVGKKVANCVSLFAYHRITAFPIDVWIARVLEEEYNNNFPFDLYKGCGGVIQQYMFYFIRNRK